MDIQTLSHAMAEAAEAGQWDRVSRLPWQRADFLDSLEGGEEASLRAAYAAGARTREAAKRLRAELETEIQNLRAARRSAGAWRPYRESSGGNLDLSS